MRTVNFRAKVDAMIDDFFDFDPDKPGGVPGSVANGCAKLFVVGIVTYGLMTIASAVLLVTLLKNLPDDLFSASPAKAPAAVETDQLQRVTVTTDINFNQHDR